jgi:FkbM family methyltransferase
MLTISPSASGQPMLTVRVGTSDLLVPGERAWAFPRGQYYELNVSAWLQRMLAAHDDAVFYDIGSNIGYYPVRFASQARQVYAFEPVAGTFAILDENVRRNALGNVQSFRLGVAEASGTAEINLWTSSGASSLYDQDLGLRSLGHETIELVALDELVALRGLLAPSVMKIDIEGAELPALRGARDVIERCAPDLVLECQEASCAAAGYRPEQLIAELESFGYRCHWLGQDHVDMRLHPTGSPDVAVQDLIALAPGSPVPVAALSEECGEPLGRRLVMARLDEVLGSPDLLEAHAARTGPDDDVTLIIWEPGDAGRLDALLVPLVARLGLDGDDGPDMLGLAAPADRVGVLLDLAAAPLRQAVATR